eukprot:10729914-Heterocapsa_arctica.AAC.1
MADSKFNVDQENPWCHDRPPTRASQLRQLITRTVSVRHQYYMEKFIECNRRRRLAERREWVGNEPKYGGADGRTPVYGVKMKYDHEVIWKPSDIEDELLGSYAMLLLHGDMECVLPVAMFPLGTTPPGLSANAFHMQVVTSYLQTKEQEGILGLDVIEVLRSLETFERLCCTNEVAQAEAAPAPGNVGLDPTDQGAAKAAPPGEPAPRALPQCAWRFPDDVQTTPWRGRPEELRGFAERILRILQ